jgi:Fe2+ or Zn2+ uptake regulation protein
MLLKRNTVQKTFVWDTIQSITTHPSAETVFEKIRQQQGKVSRATVFRLLDGLAKDGKISRVRTPYGADCYDFRTDPHGHVQCTKCGRIIDVDIPGSTLSERPADAQGFTLTGVSIVYMGRCSECQKHSEEQ